MHIMFDLATKILDKLERWASAMSNASDKISKFLGGVWRCFHEAICFCSRNPPKDYRDQSRGPHTTAMMCRATSSTDDPIRSSNSPSLAPRFDMLASFAGSMR
jgi:hypothetical protein